MLIERDLMEKVRPFLKRKEFIAIVGPRQAGKTTFLEIIGDYLHNESGVSKKHITMVTFEDRMLLSQFEKDPVAFVSSYRPAGHSDKLYLMMDEFQYVLDGGQKLKLVYDVIKDAKIFISGSSSLDIKAHVGKFMVGRILSFDLHPFSFREYLRAQDKRLEGVYARGNEKVMHTLFEKKRADIKSEVDVFSTGMIKHYEKFALWGGYPAVVLADTDEVRKKLLAEIYNNYILKDIKTLLELATERNLLLLSQYLAAQMGNIVVYQNVGQVSQLDHRQLKKHLTILEQTYVCREVRPFFKNRQKELSRNPKIYFLDLGFRNTLVENMNTMDKRPDAGAIIENAVCIRLHEMLTSIGKINFWRTKAGAEVDFVLEIKGDIVPFEVKYSSVSEGKISKSLSSFISSFKPEFAVVLTKDYWGSIQRGTTRILFVPVYYL
jgi:predicted AAA+ superfamily ATPase